MNAGMSEGAATAEETTAEETTAEEAATEEAIPTEAIAEEAIIATISNRSGTDGHMVPIPVPTISALREGTRGEQRQAHHQAKN